MPTNFLIRADTRDVDRTVRGVINGQRAAAARAINRTLTTASAAAARLISDDVGLRVTAVKKAMRSIRANAGHVAGIVDITGRRIPLIEFGARGPEPSRGKGHLTYRIGPGRRSTIQSAFIATMKSGHRGVFRRRTGARRLPIIELLGPSLPKVARNPAIQAAVQKVGEEALEKNLAHELEFLVQRRV